MYRLCVFFAYVASRLSASGHERLARWLAWFCFDVLRIRRRLMLRGLQYAYGDSLSQGEKIRLARQSVYHFALTMLEFFRAYYNEQGEEISLVGEENLRAILAEGHGAFCMVGHLGNWEVMGAQTSQRIAPVHVPMKKVGSAGMNRFVDEVRRKHHFYNIARQRRGDAYRQIKGILERNEIVGFVVDQARPGEPKLLFFGHPAKTNTSLAAMSHKLDVPVVPVSIRRLGVWRHEITYHPPLAPKHSGDAKQDVIDNSQIYNQVMENLIKDNPEQYFWFHNRWKD